MVDEDERLLLKLRGAKSVSFDQDDGEYLKLNRPDKPCHKVRDSILSSSNENIDRTGLINILFPTLVAAVAHTILESILKYGILFDPVQLLKVIFYKPTESSPSLVLLGLHVLPLSSLGIEVMLSKGLLNEKVGLIIIITLLTSAILIPSVIFCYTDCYALPAFIVLVFMVSVFLKLVSYHVTNFWCREAHVHSQKIRQHSSSLDKGRRKDIGNGSERKNLVHYPDNLNFKDLYYFLYAPTLCYELNFPRSARIRKTFLIKRVLELIILVLFVLCLFQQCIGPTFHSSFKPLQERDYARLLEIILKFIVPFVLACVTSTYTFFHSFLNALAEILKFGDRYFYNKFWDSESIMDYWYNWNIPVHNWCVRHLYLPLRHFGFTNSQTLFAVFFASAVFHELILSVSLKAFNVWFLLFFLVQVPYSIFVDRYLHIFLGATVGPYFIFFPFALCVFMYYHDYFVANYQNAEATV